MNGSPSTTLPRTPSRIQHRRMCRDTSASDTPTSSESSAKAQLRPALCPKSSPYCAASGSSIPSNRPLSRMRSMRLHDFGLPQVRKGPENQPRGSYPLDRDCESRSSMPRTATPGWQGTRGMVSRGDAIAPFLTLFNDRIRPFSFLNHPSTSSIVITRAFQGRYNQIQHQSPSFNHFAAPHPSPGGGVRRGKMIEGGGLVLNLIVTALKCAGYDDGGGRGMIQE